MNTKKEILAKIQELQAMAAKMPDDLVIDTFRAYDDLNKGKKYWIVDADGDTSSSVWYDDPTDKGRLYNGQIFLSEEAACRESRRRELWYLCRKAMKTSWEEFGEAPDWKNNAQSKHCVHIDGGDVDYIELVASYERIHFPTQGSLNAWRSTVTDDDILLMIIEEW